MDYNMQNSTASRLGEDSVFEGTLRCKGGVEIIGEFHGELYVEGPVVLRSNLQSDITADSVFLAHGTLVGDVTSAGKVFIGPDAALQGNVTASELELSGSLEGNVTVSGSTALHSSASLHGDLRTASMSIEQGALMDGRIEMK